MIFRSLILLNTLKILTCWNSGNCYPNNLHFVSDDCLALLATKSKLFLEFLEKSRVFFKNIVNLQGDMIS